MITQSFLSAFIYRLLTTVFYQVFAYFPFRKQLRFRPVWVLLSAGLTQVGLSAVYAYATMHGAPVTATTFLSAVVGFAVFLCNVRADRKKIFFLYVFILDYVLLIQGLAYFTESHLFYSPDMTFGSVKTLILILVYLAATAPFLLFFLEQTGAWAFQTESSFFWNIAWLLPASTTLIVWMFTSDITVERIRDIRFLFARVLLILILFVVYYVLLRALHLIQLDAALSKQASEQEALLAIQHTQYRQLSRHMQEIREARHDLSQHLRVIQQYLNTGSQEALQDYLDHYKQTLPTDHVDLWCENYAVNTILTYYGEEAKAAGIAFSANLNLPEELPVSEPELCSMLGNLLENALTAASEMSENAAPFIRVMGEASEEQLVISIDNSYEQKPQMEGSRYLSVKHGGYGTGISSVQTIAKKYNGEALFQYENNIFSASVFLQFFPK